MSRRTSRSTSYTSGVNPVGPFRAKVVSVSGGLASIQIPRLGMNNVYDEVPYSGFVPTVGAIVWAFFIEGNASRPMIVVSSDDSQSDINEIIAGTNLNGGGTGGTVTVNLDATIVLSSVTADNFYGALTGNVTGNVTGNADTATALATARTIGGVSFDGTSNINLPGVNTSGSQDTTGNAATATALATARAINGVNFDGSAAITVTADANTLSNTTLKSTVVASSLTSVGTLASLNVTGDVGIGTTTPDELLHVEGGTPTLQLSDTANNTGQGAIQCELLLHGRYHSGTADPNANAYSAAAIKSFKDNTDGSGGGGMSLWTSATGAGGLTQKVTIDKAGDVGIGTTAPGAKLHILDDNPQIWLQDSSSATDSGGSLNWYGSGGANLGKVTLDGVKDMRIYSGMGTGGANLYFNVVNAWQYYMTIYSFSPYYDNSKDLGQAARRFDDVYATNGTIQTSDLRDKTAVTDLDLGLDFIKQLRPVSFVWNDRSGYEGNREHMGFIAQELSAVLGDQASDRAVWVNTPAGTHDNADPDGDPIPYPDRQGIRYEELVAPLVAAVQEQSLQVESLLARVTALESSGT